MLKARRQLPRTVASWSDDLARCGPAQMVVVLGPTSPSGPREIWWAQGRMKVAAGMGECCSLDGRRYPSSDPQQAPVVIRFCLSPAVCLRFICDVVCASRRHFSSLLRPSPSMPDGRYWVW